MRPSRSAPSDLAVTALAKSFGATAALRGIDLHVAGGELFCLLGPSGCGKTTLLNLVGGLLEPDAGAITLGDRDITRAPMQQRNIGIVFQSYALFPHLTVRDNIAFGMQVRRRTRWEIDVRVGELLRLTRLEEKATRYPRQLSGGEQQRVALARALAVDPDLLLLDEPFSSLDARLRVELRLELRQVQRAAGVTAVLVTHDQDEALALGDRVGLMQEGRLVQVGTPEELYSRPRSRFAAQFVGESNLFEGTLDAQDGQVGLRCAGHFLPLRPPRAVSGPATMLVRPEHVYLCFAPSAARPELAGTVRDASYRGLGWRYEVDTALGRLLVFAPSTALDRQAQPGDAVYLGWDPAHAYLLPDEAGSGAPR